jgi:cysteine desulfurase
LNKIYLDYAATTPVDPAVEAAMLPYFSKIFGNPASLHSYGQEAKNALEKARKIIAKFIGAKDDEIVFTSGGTESNNLSIKGVAYKNSKKGNHIITTNIEHHAVLNPCKFLETQGYEVSYIPADINGFIDPEDIKKAITDKTILISIMHANNEIGTIQPIEEIGSMARERGVYFHTDAVQTLGHIPVRVEDLHADLLSASAHKLYGPKGVGFLYIRNGTRISSFMHGGEQEYGLRASTHNIPGIVGMGKAVEVAKSKLREEGKKLTDLRDKLIHGILESIEYTKLNGHPKKRLPNNVNIAVQYVEGESMLLDLDMEGIICSTGSACSSMSLEPSHVLLALGLSYEVAHGSLRFSLGRYTEQKDIERVIEVLPKVVKRLRTISSLYSSSNVKKT